MKIGFCFYCKKIIFPWSKGTATVQMSFNGWTGKHHTICKKCANGIIKAGTK